MPRLHKFVTDAEPIEMTETMHGNTYADHTRYPERVRIGAGRQWWRTAEDQEKGRNSSYWIASGYQWRTAGNTHSQGGAGNGTVNLNGDLTKPNDYGPLPIAGSLGDSGSPMFIYDAKWSLLPTKVIWIFNFLAFIYWATAFANTANGFNFFSAFNIAVSMALFPLVYFVLAKISKEEWVGGGDWILAIGLIFLLPNQPIFAMLLLFLSNFVGLIFALFQSILQFKKVKRGIRIPFGPAMILATLILLIFQQFLLIFTSFIM